MIIALAILAFTIAILFIGAKIMSGLTDLQAAVSANTTSVEANTTATQAAVTALGNQGDSDAAVEAAAQTVTANNATIEANTASLTGATPTAPAA